MGGDVAMNDFIEMHLYETVVASAAMRELAVRAGCEKCSEPVAVIEVSRDSFLCETVRYLCKEHSKHG